MAEQPTSKPLRDPRAIEGALGNVLSLRKDSYQFRLGELYAAFGLACRSPHCRFDGDFCTTAQAPLTAEERPSGEQGQAYQSISSPLCPQRQITDS